MFINEDFAIYKGKHFSLYHSVYTGVTQHLVILCDFLVSKISLIFSFIDELIIQCSCGDLTSSKSLKKYDIIRKVKICEFVSEYVFMYLIMIADSSMKFIKEINNFRDLQVSSF